MSINLASSQSSIETDSAGVSHIVWADNGYIWHAVYDNNSETWKDAQAIAFTGNEPVTSLNLVTDDKLIDGKNPGLSIVWQQGSLNDSDFFYTAGQYDRNGDLQWLDTPQAIISDQVGDLEPTVIVNNGEVIVVGSKINFDNAKNLGIQEDQDLYYQQFQVSSSQFSTSNNSFTPIAPYSPQLVNNGIVNLGVMGNTPQSNQAVSSQTESSGYGISSESTTSDEQPGQQPLGSWNAQLYFASDLLHDWELIHSVPKTGLLRSIITPFIKNWELVGTLSGGTTFPFGGETPSIFLQTNAQLEWKSSYSSTTPWKVGQNQNLSVTDPDGNVVNQMFKVKGKIDSPIKFGFDLDSTYKFGNSSPHDLISIDDILGLTASVKFPIIPAVETAGFFTLDATGSVGLHFNLSGTPSVTGGNYFPQTLGAGLKALGVTALAEGALLAVTSGNKEYEAGAIAVDIALNVAETFAAFIGGLTQGLDLAGSISFPVLSTGLVGKAQIPHVPLLSADIKGGMTTAFNWGIGNTKNTISLNFPIGFDVKVGPLALGFNFDPGWTWDVFDKNKNSASGVSSEVNSSFAVTSQPQVSGSLLTIDLGVTPTNLPKASDFTVTETDITGNNRIIPVFNVLQGNSPSTLILQLETPIAVSENYNYSTGDNPIATANQVSLSFSNSEGIIDTDNNPITDIAGLNVTNVTPNQLIYTFNPISGSGLNYQNSTLLLEINTPLDINSAPDVRRFTVKEGNKSLVIEKVEVNTNGVLLTFNDSVKNSDLQNITIAYNNGGQLGNTLKDTNNIAFGSFTVNNGVSTLVSQSLVLITNNNSSLTLSDAIADYTVTVTDMGGNAITETVIVTRANLNSEGVALELSKNINPDQNVTIKYKNTSIQTSSLVTGVTPPTIDTKSVLANVEGDLSHDSNPTLSLTNSGQVLLAWVADAPPLEPIAGFADGNTVTLNFVRSLGNTASVAPNVNQFTVKDDQGNIYTPTNISIEDSSIKFTLNKSVEENTPLTISYLPSATGTSLTSSEARNLYLENSSTQEKLWINGFDFLVNHIVHDINPPNLLGAGSIVQDVSSNRVTLVFDKKLSGNPINSDFKIKNNGVEYNIATTVQVVENTVILSVIPPTGKELIGNGNFVTLSYTGSSLSANGQTVIPFSDRTVITTPATPTTVIKYGFSSSGNNLISSPISIPGSGGFNFKPVSALDQKGNNVLVWSYADSSDIKTDLVAGEIYTDNQSSIINESLQESDLYYSIYDHTTSAWSLAQPIIEQQGTEGQIAIEMGVNGNLMAAWINYDNEGNSNIYWSELKYNSDNTHTWTTPAILYTDANPDPLTELSITTLNGKPAVFWTETQGTSYSELTFAESPLLYYRLDEAGGTTLVNQGVYGAGGYGIYNGNVTFNQIGALENNTTNDGDTNPAVLFNKGNSATSSVIPLSGSSFTLEFWFKTPVTPTAKTTLVSSLNLLEVSLGANSALSLNLHNGQSLSYNFEGNYQPNTWYSVTATYDGEKDALDLYLNGKPVANANNVDFTLPSSTVVTLGSASNTTAVSLDEVALYRQAFTHSNFEVDIVNDYPLITEDVVADSFSSQFTSFTDTVNDRAPLLYYRLGETEGTTLVNEGVYGATGNGTYNNSITLDRDSALFNTTTQEGDRNSSVLFNANGSGSIEDVTLQGNSYGFEFWFKTPNTPQEKTTLLSSSELLEVSLADRFDVKFTRSPRNTEFGRSTQEYSHINAFAALKDDGSVVTWGNQGRLDSSVASQLTSGVVNVFSSMAAFAALKDNGSVVTWGSSGYGGDNSAVANQLTSGVRQIFSTGHAFAALKDNGSVVTWGDSSSGGDSRSVANQLTSGVRQIFSTEYAFAALKNNGSVVTWGQGTVSFSKVASQLTSGVVEIFSTGGGFAALKNNGSVVTWGSSSYYGGNSSGVTSQLSSGVKKIFASQFAFAALKDDGSVVTWGGSDVGGDSSAVADQLTSEVVEIFSTPKAFAAIKNDGSVVTWGDSSSGGNSSGVASKLISGVVNIFSTGEDSSQAAFAALKNDGSVVTWGSSDYGGDSSAVASKLTSGVVEIFASRLAFAALKEDGSVVTWGNSIYGGNSSAVASKLTSGVVEIFSTDTAFAALKEDGSVVTWGDSSNGGNSSAVASQLSSGVTTIADPLVSVESVELGATLSLNLNNGQSLLYDFEGNYQPDTWYYVVGNYDGDNDTVDLFVNGESVGNLNDVDLPLPNSTDITLGSTLNQDQVYLDEVAIYGQTVVDRKTVTGLDDLKDLTPSQISEILFNTDQIGNKYASQYLEPLPSGANTQYVVHDGSGWSVPSIIDPTYKPIATQLTNANKAVWDVTSYTTANSHGTVNPNGNSDIFLSLSLANQVTGRKISSIEVTATNSNSQTITWTVGKTTGNQLAVVQGEKLLNPLNPNGSFDYTILSPNVDLDLFLDGGNNTFSDTTTFNVKVNYDNNTSTPQSVTKKDVTSEPTTINSNQVLGIATVTEANDSSLALIDSGFIVNTNNAGIGYVMKSGDFNKDGKIDVAVGNRGYTDTSGTVLGQGTIQILFNDGAVLSNKETNPLTTTDLTGNPNGVLITGLSDKGEANGDFPFSMATGDVNGDNYIDLIIGDPNVNNKQGAVYVIYGSQMTAGSTIDVTNLGTKGYKITPTTSGSMAFGYSVAVGNFNTKAQSDGSYASGTKADIVIGAPGANNGNGAVYVAYDGSSSYSAIYNSIVKGELAGYSVAVSHRTTNATTFTGNSISDDVIIGAIGHTANVTNEWNGLSGLDNSANKNPSGESYPSTSTSKVGAVYVYKSNGTSSNTFSQALSYIAPNLPSSNGTANDLLAGSALVSGDIDGDGQNDLAISAPGGADNQGIVYLLKGGQTNNSTLQNLGNVANLQIVGGLPFSQTGSVIEFVGDINNDKHQDMIITAPSGANGTGQSYVIFGRTDLLNGVGNVMNLNVTATDNKRTLLLNGSQPYQLAGTAVTGISDVNGDKVDDLMISAPNAGQLYVIYGHPWLADDGSIKMANISGDNGFVIDGNLYSVGGSTLTDNGKNVVLLGDVNGDGFADVLSGGSGKGGILTFGTSTQNLIDAAAGTDDIIISLSNQTISKFLALGDINGDGLQDLGVIDTKNNFYVQLGSPNLPTLGSTLTLSNVSKTSIIDGFAMGDDNGDGYGDMVLRSSNGVWTLYHGSSSGTLNSTTTTFSGLTGNGLGDINGDGYSDVGFGNKNANVISPNAISNGQYSVYKGDNKGNTTTVNPPGAVLEQNLDSTQWTDQYSISDQSTPVTPTLVKFNGYLYMLYKANDNTNTLWLQRSSDGSNNWEGLKNLGNDFKTEYQPSLAVFNNTLYLAFTATDDKVILASAVDDSSSSLGIKFDKSSGVFYQIGSNTSEHGPTLVTYNNKLYTFFVGTDNKINYTSASSPSSSSSWSSNNNIPYSGGNNTTNSRIGTAVFQDKLYITFKGSNSNSVNVTHYDGSRWSSANNSASSQSISGKTSDFGGSLIATDDTLYLFYKSDGSDEEIFYTSSTNGTSWSATERIPDQSSSDVSFPVLFNQSIYVAHKGFNTDSVIYVTASNPIFEQNKTQQLGTQLQGIGDFNGDGIEDYGVLASGYATFGGFSGANFKNNQGALFIYYGSTSGTVNSNPDVVLNPQYSSTNSTIYNLSNFTAIGDINGDGYDDVAIASPTTNSNEGTVFVAFGGKTWGSTYSVTKPFDLNSLSNNQSSSSTNNSNTKGFLITGLPSSQAGISLSGGEDVNGDGLDDFVVGAPGNNDNLSYVIFGSDFNKTVTQTGTIGDDVMIGTPTGESFLGDQGNDRIYTNGGFDVVYAGLGDDFVTVNDTYFRRLDGGAGTDVLRFEGYNGQNWDLTTLSPGNRLRNFEILVTEGYGANILTLNSLTVTQLSGNNTVTVVMDEKDTLNLSTDFTLNGTVYQYNQKFDKYTSSTSAATILLNRIVNDGTTNLIKVTKNAPSTNTPANILALETLQTSGIQSEINQSSDDLTSTFRVDAEGFGSSVFAEILNDISDIPTQIRVSNPIANEADGEVEFIIQRTGDLTQYTQVHYITQDGRAKGGDHYQTVLGRAVFAPGETTKTVAVPLILDDIHTGTRDLGLLVTLEEESDSSLDHEFHLVADAGESQIRNGHHNITDIPYTTIGGALEFQATTIDGKAEIKLHYEGTKDFNHYFLFNAETQTYEPFIYDGTTGARFFDEDGDGKNDGAILSFLDGDQYDLDRTQNSLITKRGFFAFGDSPEIVLDTAMYRFRSVDTMGSYLYVDAQEKESVLTNYGNNFVEEGLAFYVSNTQEDSLIAFNRFRNTDLMGAYIYAGEEESESIRGNYPQFIDEGIAFYAYGADSQMTDSITRFQNSTGGAYLYTGQPETENVINNYGNSFNLEGMTFEALLA